MSVLESVGEGITLMASAFSSGLTIMTAEPMVYFVGLAFVAMGLSVASKLVMKRRG